MTENILTVADAQALTAQIRAMSERLWDLVVIAYQHRAWTALGYKSWDCYVQAEFGPLKIRIPKEDRREIVSSLRDHGLSLRAIGSATGYDKHTIASDLEAKAGGGFPPLAGGPRKPVTGCNGRTYPAPQSQSEFWKVTQDLCKMSDRITKLAGDGGFGGYRDTVKEASLRDLRRARTALDEVIDKLEGVSA